MAALRSTCGHYIFVLFLLGFFLAYSQWSEIGCLRYFDTWCGPRANLGCRSEMCCTLQMQDPKTRQKSPARHHRTTLSGHTFVTKAHIDNWKKTAKQQYLLHMSSQYGELQPTSGCDRFISLGHPCKFQRVSRLGSVTAQHSSIGRHHTLWRWTEGATYIPHGGHHIGHWPTFLVFILD